MKNIKETKRFQKHWNHIRFMYLPYEPLSRDICWHNNKVITIGSSSLVEYLKGIKNYEILNALIDNINSIVALLHKFSLKDDVYEACKIIAYNKKLHKLVDYNDMKAYFINKPIKFHVNKHIATLSIDYKDDNLTKKILECQCEYCIT